MYPTTLTLTTSTEGEYLQLKHSGNDTNFFLSPPCTRAIDTMLPYIALQGSYSTPFSLMVIQNITTELHIHKACYGYSMLIMQHELNHSQAQCHVIVLTTGDLFGDGSVQAVTIWSYAVTNVGGYFLTLYWSDIFMLMHQGNISQGSQEGHGIIPPSRCRCASDCKSFGALAMHYALTFRVQAI